MTKAHPTCKSSGVRIPLEVLTIDRRRLNHVEYGLADSEVSISECTESGVCDNPGLRSVETRKD